MSFDRVIAVLALIVALTGGVPTLLALLESRTYFETNIEGSPLFRVLEDALAIEIKIQILNADNDSATIFAIGHEAKDINGATFALNRSTYWKLLSNEDTPLPVALASGERLTTTIRIPMPFDSISEAHSEWAEYTQFESISQSEFDQKLKLVSGQSTEAVRSFFLETFFPGAYSLEVQMRSACDDVGMKRGLFAKCVGLSVAMQEHAAASAGEISVSFFPRLEKIQ